MEVTVSVYKNIHFHHDMATTCWFIMVDMSKIITDAPSAKILKM